MQLIYSLNLKPQNNRDRKAEQLADDWMKGKVKVLETIPVPTITKRELAQIEATPKLDVIEDDVQSLLDAIQVMRSEKAAPTLDAAVVYRFKHCVSQVVHSLKVGAARRLQRNRGELSTLVSTYGEEPLLKVCHDLNVNPAEVVTIVTK
ncbi:MULTISPECIES: hypothetical protein [unclassified Pseudomonas]|uniref:hypothetical protein n=1 Tax=unclassified Pseudomonas TaxID=196821 RepID=UPI0039B760C4